MEKPVCHIVGAGDWNGPELVMGADDLVIAADAGYARLLERGIRPHLVIGDFDSLGHAPDADHVITLPTVKDITDTWAAVEQGRQRGYTRFFLYGCTGGRFGHTLANLQTAANLARKGKECRIFTGKQVITAVSDGMELTFDEAHKGFISVFSHSDQCLVTIRGLKYELEAATLTNRFPLGVSNEFTGRQASVSVTGGIALVVYDCNQPSSSSAIILSTRR